MSTPSDTRILGLSPRARRFVIPFLAVAAVVIAISYVSSRGSDEPAAAGAVVGGDLHAVDELGTRMFVGGHGGAGYRTAAGEWTQIESLDNKDVMGWASTDSRVLAGGHAGLYASSDEGSNFDKVEGLPVSDIHALGSSGDTVYLASPEAGTFVSTDGGRTFEPRNSAGRDFMGTIWVDPDNPDTAIAPSMRDGAVKTTDGGATWAPLGSTTRSMAVAVDETGSRLLSLGMDGSAQLSTDGGGSWSRFEVPDGTSAVTYTATGELVGAAVSGDRADVYSHVDGQWDPVT